MEIMSTDLKWDLEEDRSEFILSSGGVVDFEVVYVPLGSYEPGRYGVNLLVVSDRDSIEQYLPVNVLDNYDILDVAFISSPVVDPRKETIVKLNLKNKYNIDLGLLDVELSGEGFSQVTKAIIYSKETKVVEFNLDLDEDLAEGEHLFHVKIVGGNSVYVDSDFKVNIKRYSDFKEVINVEESFLYKRSIVDHLNEGNAFEQDVYVKRLSLFERWFTRFSPKPTRVSKKSGLYYAEWDVGLKPSESEQIKIVTNYRLPIGVLVLVILVCSVIWYFKKRSVIVKRKIITIKKSVHRVSVHVNIIVKASANVKDIRIMERVPYIVGKPKYFLVKPVRMKRENDSLVMYWEFKSIMVGEEINVNYTVDCSIKEKLSVPPTVVRYSEGLNRFMATSSRVDF